MNMIFLCEIDETSNTFNIELRLEPAQLQQNPADLLSRILLLSRDITETHLASIKKSGKIQGQDRIKIIEMLDSMFVNLAVFRVFIMDEKKLNDNMNLKVPFEMKMNKFFARGNIDISVMKELKNFNDLYNQIINTNLIRLLSKFKNINEMDTIKSLDDQTVIDSLGLLDDIFYHCLMLRYNINNCLINN